MSALARGRVALRRGVRLTAAAAARPATALRRGDAMVPPSPQLVLPTVATQRWLRWSLPAAYKGGANRKAVLDADQPPAPPAGSTEVMVIDGENKQALGKMTYSAAEQVADERGHVLVQVNAGVFKLWEPAAYEQQKQAQAAAQLAAAREKAAELRKKRHLAKLEAKMTKEVKFTALSDTHDIDIKLKQARRFLEKGASCAAGAAPIFRVRGAPESSLCAHSLVCTAFHGAPSLTSGPVSSFPLCHTREICSTHHHDS